MGGAVGVDILGVAEVGDADGLKVGVRVVGLTVLGFTVVGVTIVGLRVVGRRVGRLVDGLGVGLGVNT